MEAIFWRRVRTLQPAHLRIEVTLERLFERDQSDKVRPAQLSYQRYDNLFNRGYLGELNHASQVLLGKPTSIFRFQLSRQCGDNFRPVISPLPLQYFLVDAATDAPVERGQGGVHRRGGSDTGRADHAPNVADQ